jgi:WD40 repeat protein
MRVQNKFADFTDYVRSVVWAPNGKQIAASGNHPEIRIFDVQTLLQIGNFVYSENQYQATHFAVAWSPDSKYIVSGSGNDIVGRVIVWDVGNFLTSLKAESAPPPQYFSLLQNYPNPFNASTSFEVRIPKLAFILLKIFDVHGREIETLIAEEKAPGIYTFTWNASSFDSGVYFCRLTTKGFSETKKLLFLR